MRLMREVRFSVGPKPAGPVTNSWAGWPSATGVQPYLVLRTRVEGEPDPVTGYLCNIAVIDRLIRERTVPLVARLVHQPRATGEPDPLTGVLLPIDRLESIVQEQVLERLDHKHLNRDCPQFASLNPSVENIARVIWGLLADQFTGAALKRVRVWETAKTYAEYEGPPPEDR